MANLEKLTNKIVEEAQIEADRILNEAQKEKENQVASSEKKGEREKEAMLESAKREAELRRGRVVSNAKLKVRNDKLEAKRAVLNKTFENAIGKLESLSVEEKINFIKTTLKNISVNGDEEIILSKDVKAEFEKNNTIDELNKIIEEKGIKAGLKVSGDTRNLKGGFILVKNGIELNWSFKSIMDSLREDLEGELISMLF